MIVPMLLSAGATFRRVVELRNLALALLGGGVAGLALWGLPAPSLVQPAFAVLVGTLGGLLVLPVVAALPAGDRASGYEQLVGLRPVPSASLAAGRVVGSVVGAALLVLLVATGARFVASSRQVPEEVIGRLASLPDELPQFRFGIPSDAEGPFELSLATHVPLRAAGRLTIDARRGEGRERSEHRVLPGRRISVSLPDMFPQRGDLYLTLDAQDGLVLGSEPPLLQVGFQPLGDAGLALPRELVLRIGLAVLAAVAAACAFHFETALLAGLLALLIPANENPTGTAITAGLLMLFAVMGTALVRRQAMP